MRPSPCSLFRPIRARRETSDEVQPNTMRCRRARHGRVSRKPADFFGAYACREPRSLVLHVRAVMRSRIACCVACCTAGSHRNSRSAKHSCARACVHVFTRSSAHACACLSSAVRQGWPLADKLVACRACQRCCMPCIPYPSCQCSVAKIQSHNTRRLLRRGSVIHSTRRQNIRLRGHRAAQN